MKWKLLIALLLFCVGAYAQPSMGTYTKIEQRYNWLAGYFRSLHLPTYGDTSLQSGQYRGAGAVLIDTTGSNKGLYVHYDGYWHRVSLSSEASTVTASNGVTKSTNDIQLGGTLSAHTTIDADSKIFTITDAAGIILESTTLGGSVFVTANNDVAIAGSNSVQLYTPGLRHITLKPDTLRLDPPGGGLRINPLPYQNSPGNTIAVWDSTNGLMGHVAVGSIGGGGSSTNTKEGVYKRGDTVVIDNNRNIYYITQPTSGSSIATGWTAVGTPGLTFNNGTWIFGGNAENNTQLIRNNSGVCAEGVYIEAYVIVDSLRSTSIGPRLTFKSYNPFAGGAYTHNVEAGVVTGSGATNYGKAIIYGKTGNSTNVSDSARVTNPGDTLYMRLDRDGLSYTIRIENLTQDWKLYKSVQCTPGGSPFAPHNSSYVGFIPGGGGYKVYGFRYVIKAPIQTELALVGNSIFQRQGASSEGAGVTSLVGNPVNNVVMGGGADGITEMLARVGEIIAIHPKAVILEGPGNDILFDGSLTTTTKNEYIAFRDSMVNHGIIVYHCLATPRTATDVSALWTWQDTTTTFRSDFKIDTKTPLLGSGTSLATKYDADGTHPNDAGHAQYASTINQALHRFNNDGLYATKNVIARNGYLFANDAGTGPDQNKSGAWIAALLNSTTQYMHGGFYSDYGWINAISEGSAYRDVGISTAGTAKLFVGSSLNRTAKLNVTDGVAGNTEILALKHGGSFSAAGQASQMAWYNSTSTKTGMYANVVGTGSMFDQAFHTYNGGMNTTPALYLFGDNRIKLANIPFVASKDTVMYWDPSDSVVKRTLIAGGGGGSGTVTSVSAGLGMSFSTITTSGSVGVDTAVGTGVIMWPRLNKLKDSLVSLMGGGGGSYINNGFGSQQNARFWINGAGESDSSLRGRTTGASSGFKTGGLIAYGSGTGRTSYLQFGYDNTLAAGWFQAVTEGSAYRDLIMNAAGGNLGLGTLTAAPTTLLQLQKNNYPAIKLLKTGVNPWYIGNRTESTGTDFQISYNTTDWMQMKITGETGFGNQAPSGWVHIAAGTTGIGQLILASGVVQSSPTSGAMTNVSGALKFYNGAQKRIPLTNDAPPSNGQIPIGNGTDYTVANITSTGGTITVTNGSGTINLETTASRSIIPLQDFYSSVSNSGTSETDLYTFTIPANTLTVNGEKIIAKFSGSFNDATGVETMKSYFGGTSIANIGGVAGNPANWDFQIMVTRSGTSTARASVTFLSDGVFKPGITTLLTGLDFTTTNIIKITGTSSQSVTDAIKADVGTIYWQATIAP